jgi:hypothetical protein
MPTHAFATICLRLIGFYFLVSYIPLILLLPFAPGSHSAVTVGGVVSPWQSFSLFMFWPLLCGVLLLIFSRSLARLLCRGLDPAA